MVVGMIFLADNQHSLQSKLKLTKFANIFCEGGLAQGTIELT